MASVSSFTNNTVTSASTPQSVTGVSWNSGDTIVIVGTLGSAAPGSLTAPTNANLTFTARQTQDNSSTTDIEIRSWDAVATSTESGQSISMTRSAGTDGFYIACWVLSDVGAYAGGWANLNESATSYNPAAGSIVIYAHGDWAAGAAGYVPETNTGTVTERVDAQDASWLTAYVADWVGVDAGADSWGPTSYDGSADIAQLGVEYPTSVTLTTELEGFRFEKDHASEAGDWWAAQDTNPTGVNAPFGLRAATVFTGDPGSASFKIAGYRRVGDTFWDGPPT